MAFSTYLERALLDLVFGGTAYSAPATIYVAASTGLASAAVAEPSGNGYARVAVTNNATNFPASTGSNPATKSNGTAITFPTVTGTGQSWGTIASVALYDAASGGNLLGQANLSTAQVANSGSTLSIPASDLVITET